MTRARVLSGAGNRFLVVDGWDSTQDGAALARSSPHDGVLTIEPDEQADMRLIVHNRDGSRARMCGNGLRCAVHAARTWGRVEKRQLSVATDIGALRVTAVDERITCEVGTLRSAPADVPTSLPGPRIPLATVLDLPAAEREAFVFALGGPHLVIFVQELSRLPLDSLGPRLERHLAFPDRVNVHFARRVEGGFHVRSWERGAGATAACGTGAAAVAIAGSNLEPTETSVHSSGGTLQVEWSGKDASAWVAGPTIDEGEPRGSTKRALSSPVQ